MKYKTRADLLQEIERLRRRIAELEAKGGAPDITECKRKEEEASRMVMVVRDSNDAITMQDFEGKVLAWNRGAELMYGYSEEEALQKNIWLLTPPGREEEQKDFTRRLIAGEAITSLETQRKTKDGRILDVWMTVTKLVDDAGKPIGIASTERDITEHKRMEDVLIIRNRIADVFLSVPDDEMFAEVLKIVLEVMQSPYGVFGYIDEAGALVIPSMTRHIWDKCQVPEKTITFPRDKWGDSSWPRAIKEKRANYTNRESVNTPEGHINIVRHISMPILFRGEVIGLLQVANKITDYMESDLHFLEIISGIIAPVLDARLKRTRQEEELRESESKFKSLYDSNIIGVIFWDTAGNIIQANGEFLRIVGYTEDDVLSGRARWRDMTPPEYAYLDEKAIKEMTETGISAPFEKEYIRKDGSRVPIRLNAALLKGERDIGICFIQDIAARKRDEEALKQKTTDLERSNKELEQFAYVASHDLQEPLRMVSSYTQLLAQRYEGQLDDKAKKYIDYAVDGAVRMQRLINDLLIYSRVGTRGKPFEPTDSHSVLGEVLRNLQATIEESQAIITNDDLPTVRADASQFAQVFQNLIGNAIKFRLDSPPHIHVSARDQGHKWVFSVADNGIGIDPQYKDRLFAIFQRLHTKQEYPGTGIGLALCKKIVERHGGKIWFESEPGKGSTFFFSIPK